MWSAHVLSMNRGIWSIMLFDPETEAELWALKLRELEEIPCSAMWDHMQEERAEKSGRGAF